MTKQHNICLSFPGFQLYLLQIRFYAVLVAMYKKNRLSLYFQLACKRQCRAPVAIAGNLIKLPVGVNKFQIEEKPVEGLLKVDASVGEKQKAKVEAMKAKRDNAAVEAALADLEAACKDENENLMPHILAAVKTYATLGEICGVMRKVFGEYEAHVNL